MAAPTGVSITGTQVILEISDSVSNISNFTDTKIAYGAIVLQGAGATIYTDGDIVMAKECDYFQSESIRYAITLEANILLQYTPV